MNRHRMGIDLGGSKISVIVLDERDQPLLHKRVASPQNNYNATVSVLRDLVLETEAEKNIEATVGIGMPGSVSPYSGLVQNANSIWLNGKPFRQDLEQALSRPLRLTNDADCFSLSEATDGAGAGYDSVFGVIIGTGCGGGLVVDGKLKSGPGGITGEWGHNPLPWPTQTEIGVTRCWCGQSGCMETWVSGPGFSEDHFRHTCKKISAETIAGLVVSGDQEARASLERYTSRLARGLAGCVNFFDPHIIVLGGGLSSISSLYDQLPEMMKPYIFCDHNPVRISPPLHGDDSGVRGAARLWEL